jgi:hypothetical protein
MTTLPACPICGAPLRLLSERHREYVCPVALRGVVEGKLSESTRHKQATVYVERPSEDISPVPVRT